ncbi:MAG TPA: DUF5916 domain-containing protein [Gemmatimonadales bacterium]|nr:DUF5916 domain-containing protein [Gemmatimonadales bacterium]
MLLPLLLTLQAALAAPAAPADPSGPAGPGPDSLLALAVHRGRARELDVRPPREEAEVVIDGVLDEAVWGRAAVLADFTQFAPVDGVPARDTTEVRVWYGPTAIYFGIRAREAHGAVHATLADRDRIGADDGVQLYLGTFNDGRQATVFGVNPFGVQMDGALVETGSVGGVGWGVNPNDRLQPDLSPDYTWQSKGRLVPGGYEVEIRVPFKSLRFQRGDAERGQTWTLQVVRRVQHSGAEDTWAPARRASASFLAQSGRLVGLSGLHRGLVVDVNPEVTSNRTGRRLDDGTYDYTGGRPDVGGNVRWGVTNDLTLNGTVNPDFSQVESDAGQLAFDPRQALFFDEKRPFFLDGIEQFATPNQLIYTRRIVQPLAAAKLTGKVAGTSLALLSAVDDDAASSTGADRPVYNLLRVQKDVGGQSRVGIAYTDRIEGGAYNRVADVDARLVFGRIYTATVQLAGSRTRADGRTVTAPLWMARLDATGRTLGLRSLLAGVDDDFVAGSGFLSRTGIVHSYLNPYATHYGRPGAFLERLRGGITVDGIWQYERFIHGGGIQDRKLHFDLAAQLRGGWGVGGGYFVESFGYDEALYAGYWLRQADGTFTKFTGQPRIPNGEFYLQVNTPQYKWIDANAFFLYGHDENFAEWASGELWLLQGAVNLRPTDKLRVGVTYDWQQVNRRTDGSTVSLGRIPRLKLEYQLARPLFVRLIGEYQQVERDSLRDESRSGLPIYTCRVAGGAAAPAPADCTREGARATHLFHGDALVAYQPTPGTVVFAGYGSSMLDAGAFAFRDLRRTNDGVFVKLSYLFRL